MCLTVDSAAVAFGCDRSKVIEIFKIIDRQGVARFIRGRRGWPSRLEGK